MIIPMTNRIRVRGITSRRSEEQPDGATALWCPNWFPVPFPQQSIRERETIPLVGLPEGEGRLKRVKIYLRDK